MRESSICDEGNLPLIFLLDSNIVIALSYVEFSKDTSSFQLVDNVSCEWKGVVIFDRDLVELSVILYEMKMFILFLHKEYW